MFKSGHKIFGDISQHKAVFSTKLRVNGPQGNSFKSSGVMKWGHSRLSVFCLKRCFELSLKRLVLEIKSINNTLCILCRWVILNNRLLKDKN